MRTMQQVSFSRHEIEAEAKASPAKLGIVQKIAKMSVAQRVKLALLGTREERDHLGAV